MFRGVALKIGATLAFALMAALVKAAARDFPVAEIVFFRSIFAMATLAAWLASRGEWPAALKTTRPLGHVGRSLAGTCGMFGNFVAIALLPLADASAFTFVTPLIVAALASILLGEEVRPTRVLAVAAGFAGVLVMLSGDLGMGSGDASAAFGATVALLGAAAAGVAVIQTRRLTTSEATGAIVFYFSAVTAVVSLAILAAAMAAPGDGPFSALAGQRFVLPDPTAFVGLAAIGLLGGGGQIMMTHCFRFADATVIAALDYVSMIWATVLGFLLFDEQPTPRVLAGAAIVIAGGAALLLREHAARRIGRLEPIGSTDRTKAFDVPNALP